MLLPDLSADDIIDDDGAAKRALRELVVAGGRPYILVTVTEPETGGCELSYFGIEKDNIPAALREIAGQL